MEKAVYIPHSDVRDLKIYNYHIIAVPEKDLFRYYVCSEIHSVEFPGSVSRMYYSTIGPFTPEFIQRSVLQKSPVSVVNLSNLPKFQSQFHGWILSSTKK
jgi:hypothetical protein